MKTKILNLILVIGISFFVSCNKDDNSTQEDILEGTWDLKKIYGGFANTIVYETGAIMWTFDVSESKVVIQNNIMTASESESGTYDYRIEQEGEMLTLFIDDKERGDIIILSEKKLKLDLDTEADGFFTELEK